MKETIEILAGIVAVIFIFAPHEFAHAFVAYKCGDATAKMAGRLSLNPLKHLDPAGFLLCAIITSHRIMICAGSEHREDVAAFSFRQRHVNSN